MGILAFLAEILIAQVMNRVKNQLTEKAEE